MLTSGENNILFDFIQYVYETGHSRGLCVEEGKGVGLWLLAPGLNPGQINRLFCFLRNRFRHNPNISLTNGTLFGILNLFVQRGMTVA